MPPPVNPASEMFYTCTGCIAGLALRHCRVGRSPQSHVTDEGAGAGEGVVGGSNEEASPSLRHLPHVGPFMDLLTTPSQVVHRPWCCWLSALILYCSSSALTTSVTTSSFLLWLWTKTWELDFSGTCSVFRPKRAVLERLWGSPSHLLMKLLTLYILCAVTVVISHSLRGHIKRW